MPTFTQTEIDAFKQAMLDRQNARSLTEPDGQSIQFGALEEDQAHLAYMERNLVSSAASSRTRYVVTSKGV